MHLQAWGQPGPARHAGPGPTPFGGDRARQRDERQRRRLLLNLPERSNHLGLDVRRVSERAIEHPGAVLSDQPGKRFLLWLERHAGLLQDDPRNAFSLRRDELVVGSRLARLREDVAVVGAKKQQVDVGFVYRTQACFPTWQRLSAE